MGVTRMVSAIIVAAAVGFAVGTWLGIGRGGGEDTPAAVPGVDRQGAAPAATSAVAPAADTIEPIDSLPATAPGGGERPPGAGRAEVAPAVTLADIEALLGALPARERDTWLADTDALGRLVEEESALRSILAAAEVNRALDDPLTALLVQRARDRTLADLYLARVVRANLSPGWPQEADVSRLLAEQPEQFRLPERVPVWQIFLSVEAGAGETAAAAVEARARELSVLLRKGKAEFAVVAGEHSEHAASRAAGGYMGLLAVPDLLPELRELLGKLSPGGVSEPIRTAQGWHLVRFGERQPGRALAEAEARTLARQVLLREATIAIREAALEKIREAHPVSVAEADIDAWHQALLSRDWGTSEVAAIAPDAAPAAIAEGAPESSGALARPDQTYPDQARPGRD